MRVFSGLDGAGSCSEGVLIANVFDLRVLLGGHLTLRYTEVHLSLCLINPLNAELNPICYLLALLAHHFLHVSRIRVKSLTLKLIMSYIYGAPILDVSRSHTTTHHSR